jgi:cysteine desulfurase
MTRSRIYLDHAATTPLLPVAREAMLAGFARWANPSSPHAEGREARAALEDARARIATALGWQGEVILTASASEALALGLGRAKAARRLVAAAEHDAVFRAAPDAEVLPIADDPRAGGLDPSALAAALAAPGRAVVAVQSVNSETGTIVLPGGHSPTIDLVRAAGGIVLSDCSQSAGKGKLPDADMIVVSAHKLGGPIGIGALLVKDFALIEPIGGQERGYRPGTENLPAALGFAAALEAGGEAGLMSAWRTSATQRLAFRDALWEHSEVVAPGVTCSHIVAVASGRLSANALLMRLDAQGVAVSAGSACSSGTLKPSRALAAFGVAPEVARNTIRVSIGWSTTPEELATFAEAWQALNARAA